MIRDRILKGEPLSHIPVIDVHCHFGAFGGFYVPNQTHEDFIDICDRLGVDKMLISSHMCVGSDCAMGNNLSMEFIQKYPGRIFGYVGINPNADLDIKAELDRCFAVEGFVGIKTLPKLHNRRFMAKEYHAVYEYASQKQCPFLIHTWGEDEVMEIEQVAQNYKDFPIIMAHSGAVFQGFNRAVDVANKYTNVYLDTALSFAPQGNIEWLVSQVGSKKVVYGSDMQYFDPRITFGRIGMAELSENEKMDILGGNAERIFRGLI